MALSYQTNWDTCQFLDYPSTPSFTLPELIDMDFQQSTLSLDHFNIPSLDPIFDTTIEDYSFTGIVSPSPPCFDPYTYQYPYPYPYQTMHESKPCMSDANVDFSDGLFDYSTSVKRPHCLSDGLVDYSTSVKRPHCLSDGHVDYSTSVKRPHCLSDGHVDFSTNVKRLCCHYDAAPVDFSTNVEKLPSLSGYPVDFSTGVDRLSSLDGLSYRPVDFSTSVDRMPPPVFNIGSGGGGGGTLSAQSVAARQRRRKITERTHELGKMVPGGNKMNTAEMFGAAYEYIKYLQAQVGMLQLLDSTQEKQDEQLVHNEVLEKLLSSSKIQEKLYSRGKCLVPNKLIENLAKNHELQKSNPLVTKEIQQLVRKSG